VCRRVSGSEMGGVRMLREMWGLGDQHMLVKASMQTHEYRRQKGFPWVPIRLES
jgi:hypothetical protein